MSSTFCIVPWKHLAIHPDGSAQMCCRATGPVTAVDGTPLSVCNSSLDEIWNADQMRGVRRAMLAGESVPLCASCYQQEAAGGISDRVDWNRRWQAGALNEENWTLDDVGAHARAYGYRAPAPSSLELFVGNQCNLKCRMCGPGASTRIARDAVHKQWTPGGDDLVPPDQLWGRLGALTRDLLRDQGQLRVLHIVGGEPLIMKEVGTYLQLLIDAGVAPRIDLMFSTNATTTRSPWLELVGGFRRLDLFLSIDGFGPYHEYIRYPARWDTFVRNLAVFQRLPKTYPMAAVSLQAYNALNLVELLRFLDAAGLPFNVNAVAYPAQLRPDVLPPRARRLAARRLRDYAADDCLPHHRELVLSHADVLEAQGDDFDADLLRQFMLFTNDLDVSRGQSFRRTHAELLRLIEDAGFAWTDETRHAARRPLAVVAD